MINFDSFFEGSQKELDVYNHGRFEECVQHLADLGYLNISEKEGIIVPENDYIDAIKLFRTEAIREKLISPESLLPNLYNTLNPREILSSEELNLLHTLTALDGEFVLMQLPLPSHTTLRSRVFHFRMNLLGLYGFPVNLPYSHQSEAAWRLLKSWFCDIDDEKLLYLCGDFNDFLFEIKKCDHLKNRVLYFEKEPNIHDSKFSINKNPDFFIQLKKDTKHNSSAIKAFKIKANSGEPDFNYLSSKVADPLNNFMIRLVQLNQWIAGSYTGTIDSIVGELTFDSLLNTVQTEVENGNIHFTSWKLMGHIGQGYWAVNIHYLLNQFEGHEKGDFSFATFFNRYKQITDQFNTKETNTFNQNMEQAWEQVNKNISSNLKSSNKRFRRVYMGAKNMIRSMMSKLEWLLKKLSKVSIKTLKPFLNMILNLSKMLFKEIREGISLFKKGIHFLFNRKFVTADTLLTQFDFDFDTVQTCNLSVICHHEVTAHNVRIKEASAGIRLSMYITGKVLGWATGLKTLTWPAIAFQLGMWFKLRVTATLQPSA